MATFETSVQIDEYLVALIENPSSHKKEDIIEAFENAVNLLKASRSRGDGRKEQVLELLREGPATLQELAEKLTR